MKAETRKKIKEAMKSKFKYRSLTSRSSLLPDSIIKTDKAKIKNQSWSEFEVSKEKSRATT